MDKRLLLIISWNYLSTYLAYSAFPPYFPKVAEEEKGVDQQTIGFIMSFWYVGYAIAAIFMSHILLYTGRKTAVLLGLVVLSFDFILATICGRITDKFFFIISYWFIRFIHGAGQAFIQVTTYWIIATWFKHNIAKVVGIIEFAWGLGIGLGPLICEFLYNISGFNLPLYVYSSLMIVWAIVTYFFMSDIVEGGGDQDESKDIQNTESTISIPSIEEENREKIPIWQLFTYKLFMFAIFSAFFNLILYTLLEPILTGRLTDLGVKEQNIGQYFCIQPFIYSFTSVFVDFLILKRISKRLWLIIGFYLFAVGFVITGPSKIIFLEPSVPLICFGLFLLGIGCSLSFVPIFPEMIESVVGDYLDRIDDLNNTVAGLMNAFYGSAALGQI